MQPILVVRETVPSARWSVYAVCGVCELPLGQNTLGLLFFGSPTPLSHPYILRDPPLFAPSAENTHMYQLTAVAEVVDVAPSVCVFVGIVSVVR